MIPRRRQTFVGGSDYRRTGDEFLRYFVELARLQPDERVLDVGCGSGRMARPLTGYLRPRGSYDGFDIVPRGIDWAQRTISARFPHFRFQLADVRNDIYNPDGLVPAAEYRFPYADETFDLVVLTSVFTHMRAAEVRHYLDEVARVLRPGGRCLITFFLLNDESRPALAAGASDFTFRYGEGIVRFDHPTKPEAAVAYEEDAVRAWFDAVGLSTEEPIRYGSWCRRPSSLSYQDILVASKPPG
jgi:SAM-dependent methyltransferase